MMALVISGALAALGGAFLSVGHLTLFTRNMSNGRGWVGVTAALFGFNHPIGVAFSGFFFGFIEAFSVRLQNVTDLPPSLVQVFPHLATILALVLVALQGKYTNSHKDLPAALCKQFLFRDIRNLASDHWFAQVLADFSEDTCVLIVGSGFDDSDSPLGRIT